MATIRSLVGSPCLTPCLALRAQLPITPQAPSPAQLGAEVRSTLRQYAAIGALVLEATCHPRRSLPGSAPASEHPALTPLAADVLGCPSALQLVEQWAAALSQPVGGPHTAAHRLAELPAFRALRPLQLHSLPPDFATLTSQLHARCCIACSRPPVEPALCLVCGALVCADRRRRDRSADITREGSCTRHARECSAGAALFYLVHKGVVLLVDGPHSAYHPSLYVDAHGEEDRDLRRGNPLFLSQERVATVHKLWLSHALPNAVARRRAVASVVFQPNHF